jgi:hypothetical protein
LSTTGEKDHGDDKERAKPVSVAPREHARAPSAFSFERGFPPCLFDSGAGDQIRVIHSGFILTSAEEGVKRTGWTCRFGERCSARTRRTSISGRAAVVERRMPCSVGAGCQRAQRRVPFDGGTRRKNVWTVERCPVIPDRRCLPAPVQAREHPLHSSDFGWRAVNPSLLGKKGAAEAWRGRLGIGATDAMASVTARDSAKYRRTYARVLSVPRIEAQLLSIPSAGLPMNPLDRLARSRHVPGATQVRTARIIVRRGFFRRTQSLAITLASAPSARQRPRTSTRNGQS